MSTALPPLTSHPEPEAPRRGPRRRPLVALVAATALLGGVASTGLLALSGQLDAGGGAGTPAAPPATSGGAAALDAAAVYARVAPGVVGITATGGASAPADPFGPGPGDGAGGSEATGSGFVADGGGRIVTAAHVVAGATQVTVTFADGTKRTARVAGTDAATDLAVLRVDPDGLELRPLTLAPSDSVRVGDPVAAVGSPFGYRGSLSTGVVSGLGRTIEAPNGFTVARAIQTDAALNPGNSGGPVVDASGRVVGVAAQIATGGSRQSAGVGFAVPSDVVAEVLDELRAGATVDHPYLGVSTSDATRTSGATIGAVTPGSPAASAGLRAGDVVIAIDGEPLADSAGLVAAVAAREPGDAIRLTLRRGAETVTATASLGVQPAAAGAPAG